jgi:hypothetical protein
VDALAFSQIDYFETVVSQRTDEQSLARWISSKVVDPSFDARQ